MITIKIPYRHTIQLFENDCGTAVVISIFKYFGINLNYVEVKKALNNDSEGTNIFNLKNFFISAGITSKIYKVPKEHKINIFRQISNTNLPCILMIENNSCNHFVVLYKIRNNGKCIISDPNHPKIEEVLLKDLIDNVIIILSCQRDREIDIPINMIRNKNKSIFIEIIKMYKKEILCISLISIILVGINLIISSVFGFIIDGILPNSKNISSFFILLLFVMFSIFSLSDATLKYFKLNIVQKLTNSIESLLYSKYINKILYLKNESYQMMKSGEYITRLKEGMKMTELISTILTNSIVNFISILLSMIILMNINSFLGLLNIGVCIIAILIIKMFYNRMLYNSYQISDSYAKLDSEIISTLSTIENIKIFNNENISQKKINDLVNNFIKTRNISFNISKSASTYQNIVIQISNVIILSAGAMLITTNDLTIGTLVIFMNITSIVLASILELVSVQLDIETFIVTYKRFVAILDNIETDFNEVEEHESIESIESITFCNVTMGFKNKLLLEDVNIEFSSADKNIVIYGESGCGKSTLAKTLIKLNYYYTGSIYINGKELRDINSSQIRDEIIYLSNVAPIKETTIIDFLTDGRKIPNEKIINICKDLNIFEFINCLPGKFSYLISEEGKNISLGQKQRLTIAYALLKNPSIIIFDETFSNIDSKNKEIILNNLEKYNVLKIYITHQYLDFNNMRAIEFVNYKLKERRE